MKLSKLSRKQQTVYLLVGLLALLAAITLLNAINDKWQVMSEARRAERERQQAEQALLDKSTNAINALQQYQKYCTGGIERVDMAGDVLKLVKSTAGQVAYIKADVQYSCSPSITTDKDCNAIMAMKYDTVYTCPKTPTAAVLFNGNGLQIKTQEPGTAVVLDTVILAQPGFVVIFDDAKGKPGTIVSASSLVPAKAHEYVSIAIPQPLAANKTYYALLYNDTDNNGNFDAKVDQPMVTPEGAQIMVAFKTMAPAKR